MTLILAVFQGRHGQGSKGGLVIQHALRACTECLDTRQNARTVRLHLPNSSVGYGPCISPLPQMGT